MAVLLTGVAKSTESPGCSSRRRIRWSDRWTPTRDTRTPPEAGHPLSDCPTATGVRQTGRGEPTPAAPPSCDLSYMPTAGSHVFRGSHVASGSRVFRGTHVFRIEQTQPEVMLGFPCIVTSWYQEVLCVGDIFVYSCSCDVWPTKNVFASLSRLMIATSAAFLAFEGGIAPWPVHLPHLFLLSCSSADILI